MDACKHADVEFLGFEKTDAGQNRYMKCRSCGSVIVMTAEGKVVSIKGVESRSGELGLESEGTHPE